MSANFNYKIQNAGLAQTPSNRIDDHFGVDAINNSCRLRYTSSPFKFLTAQLHTLSVPLSSQCRNTNFRGARGTLTSTSSTRSALSVQYHSILTEPHRRTSHSALTDRSRQSRQL